MEFLRETKLPIPTEFDRAPDHGARFRVEDAEFERAWRNFHARRAVLVVLHKACHAAAFSP